VPRLYCCQVWVSSADCVPLCIGTSYSKTHFLNNPVMVNLRAASEEINGSGAQRREAMANEKNKSCRYTYHYS
jgi:hypothetical protein